MADITIRPARREDVPAIVALLADDPLGRTRETATDPLPSAYRRAFDDIAAQPGNFLLVAERDGTIAGCLQLTVIPGLSRHGLKRGLIEAVRVGDVHRDGKRFTAGSGDFGNDGGKLFRIPRGGCHARACLRQRKRRGASDSL